MLTLKSRADEPRKILKPTNADILRMFVSQVKLTKNKNPSVLSALWVKGFRAFIVIVFFSIKFNYIKAKKYFYLKLLFLICFLEFDEHNAVHEFPSFSEHIP